jgi:hypothetical protein
MKKNLATAMFIIFIIIGIYAIYLFIQSLYLIVKTGSLTTYSLGFIFGEALFIAVIFFILRYILNKIKSS